MWLRTLPLTGTSFRGSIRVTNTCVPFLVQYQNQWLIKRGSAHSKLCSGSGIPGPSVNVATGRPICAFCIQNADNPVMQYPSCCNLSRLQFASRSFIRASSSACSASNNGMKLEVCQLRRLKKCQGGELLGVLLNLLIKWLVHLDGHVRRGDASDEGPSPALWRYISYVVDRLWLGSRGHAALSPIKSGRPLDVTKAEG